MYILTKGEYKMKKAHINSLRNLLAKYNKEEIIANIDRLNFDKADLEAKQHIMSTTENAVEWFTNFCNQYNLTISTHIHKNKNAIPDLYYVEEFGKSGYNKETKTYEPYFMLWVNDIGPHVEMGSSYINDLWGSTGMSDLETKMHKIVAMKKKLEVA